jgi:hypothetical protein
VRVTPGKRVLNVIAAGRRTRARPSTRFAGAPGAIAIGRRAGSAVAFYLRDQRQIGDLLDVLITAPTRQEHTEA